MLNVGNFESIMAELEVENSIASANFTLELTMGDGADFFPKLIVHSQKSKFEQEASQTAKKWHQLSTYLLPLYQSCKVA